VKRVVAVLAAVLLVVSCSSKSSEEKAAEEVAEAAMEAIADHDFEEILKSLSGDEVGEAKEVFRVSKASEETARPWPDKFCSLEIGMTRDEVQAIMGTPTSTFRNWSANQDSYYGWGWMLKIFYDVDDRAEQLQSNPFASGKVPCESVRYSE
jgi:hypothetical protein